MNITDYATSQQINVFKSIRLNSLGLMRTLIMYGNCSPSTFSFQIFIFTSGLSFNRFSGIRFRMGSISSPEEDVNRLKLTSAKLLIRISTAA